MSWGGSGEEPTFPDNHISVPSLQVPTHPGQDGTAQGPAGFVCTSHTRSITVRLRPSQGRLGYSDVWNKIRKRSVPHECDDIGQCVWFGRRVRTHSNMFVSTGHVYRATGANNGCRKYARPDIYLRTCLFLTQTRQCAVVAL